jgi:hypothetical protein
MDIAMSKSRVVTFDVKHANYLQAIRTLKMFLRRVYTIIQCSTSVAYYPSPDPLDAASLSELFSHGFMTDLFVGMDSVGCLQVMECRITSVVREHIKLPYTHG